MLFTSEITGKSYKTVEELEAAEQKVADAKAKAEAEKNARSAELETLNKIGTAYLELVANNDKVRDELRQQEKEASDKFTAELNRFAEAHNGYHLTYTKDGTNIKFEIDEVKLNQLEKANVERRNLLEARRRLWNSFFDLDLF